MIWPPDHQIARSGEPVCGARNEHVPLGRAEVISADCSLIPDHGFPYHFSDQDSLPGPMWWKDREP